MGKTNWTKAFALVLGYLFWAIWGLWIVIGIVTIIPMIIQIIMPWGCNGN